MRWATWVSTAAMASMADESLAWGGRSRNEASSCGRAPARSLRAKSSGMIYFTETAIVWLLYVRRPVLRGHRKQPSLHLHDAAALLCGRPVGADGRFPAAG